VVQLRNRLGLGQETRERFCAASHFAVDPLDCHGAFESRIEGAKDLSHATLAQQFLDLVALAEIDQWHLIVGVTCQVGHVRKGRKSITGSRLVTYALLGLGRRVPFNRQRYGRRPRESGL
jgi:hypothetical protein